MILSDAEVAVIHRLVIASREESSNEVFIDMHSLVETLRAKEAENQRLRDEVEDVKQTLLAEKDEYNQSLVSGLVTKIDVALARVKGMS